MGAVLSFIIKRLFIQSYISTQKRCFIGRLSFFIINHKKINNGPPIKAGSFLKWHFDFNFKINDFNQKLTT